MQIIITPRYARILIVLNLLFILSGCQTLNSSKDWPDDIPDRQIFVEGYERDKARGEKVLSLTSHLAWIKKFYQGTTLYTFGWNRMTEVVIESLQDKSQTSEVTSRLYHLGLDISLDWVRDNNVRNISSANISVWGNALRTAARENRQLEFIGAVEKDVQALLTGQLDKRDIKRERYFPPEDFDDF